MNLINICLTTAKTVGRKALHTAVEHKGTAAIITGLVLVGVGTVAACKATLGVEEVLDEHKSEAEKIKSAKMEEGDRQHAMVSLYFHTTWKLVKLYGKAVSLGTSGGILILYGAKVLNNKVAAATAAAISADEASKRMYDNVAKRFGKEVADEVKYGYEEVEREVIETDKKGEEKKRIVKEKTIKNDPNSTYCLLFEEYVTLPDGKVVKNNNWSPNPDDNFRFLKCALASLQDKMLLHTHHLSWNEVVMYILGNPAAKIEEGQDLGWWMTDDGYFEPGTSIIDFGLYEGLEGTDAASICKADMVVRRIEPNVMIKLNHHGYVSHKLGFRYQPIYPEYKG